METEQSVIIKDKKVKLVDGEFTPDQALDIISTLINDKINYHKIENLRNWERNHEIDPSPFLKRIQELQAEKKAITKHILEMKAEGKMVKINGVLTVKAKDE